jgi:hypothetical protein
MELKWLNLLSYILAIMSICQFQSVTSIFLQPQDEENSGLNTVFKRSKCRGRTYHLFEDIISYPYPGPQKGYYILSLSRQKKGYPLSKFLPALSQTAVL